MSDERISTSASYESSRAKDVLLAALGRLLDCSHLATNDNYYEVGGDSLTAVRLASHLRNEGWQIAIQDVLGAPTLGSVASKMQRVSGSPRSEHKHSPASAEFPLSPVQRNAAKMPSRFNLAEIVGVPEGTEPDHVTVAVRRILETHEMLRVRVSLGAQEGHQEILSFQSLPQMTAVERVAPGDRARVKAIADSHQGSLSLSGGKACSFVTLVDGPSVWGVLVVINHTTTDGIGWQVVVEDLVSAMRCAVNHHDFTPVRTSSFRSWVEYLHDLAASSAAARVADEWLDLVSSVDLSNHPILAEVGQIRRLNTVSVARSHWALDTGAVHSLCTRFGAEVLALACLNYALSSESGDGGLIVSMATNGRQLAPSTHDFSRTVGSFTDEYPVILHVDESATPTQMLEKTAAALLAARTLRGIYGCLRYLTPDAGLRQLIVDGVTAKVAFNFRGSNMPVGSGTESVEYLDYELGEKIDSNSPVRYNLSIACDSEPSGLRTSWRFHSLLTEIVTPMIERFDYAFGSMIEAERS